MDKPQIIVHLEKSIGYTVFNTCWVPCSAKLLVLGSMPKGTGILQIYEFSKGNLNLVEGSECPTGLRCGTFGASSFQQRQIATGDFKGVLNIWDIESLKEPVYTAKAHADIVNAIDGVAGLGIGVGAPEVVTGGRDGTVKVWDPRQKDDPVVSIEPNEGERRRDCWTVAFGGAHSIEERVVCAGFENGDIKMFDLRSMGILWETNAKNGICSVEFDRKDIPMNKVVATTLESKFMIFDLRTRHPTKGFSSLTQKTAHKSTVWLCRHLPQNRDLFMTGGGSGSLCLWKYSYPASRVQDSSDGNQEGVMGAVNLLQNANIAAQPICGFEWNHDKLGLAACTAFDQTIRVIIVTKLNTY
ncbi:unnamed protein product [Darwinula stevensoni]|uniref:Dynein axonemal assembly factor 10 n=1 Tax=Darwinula stevensoni TaxID=69355 RepID=A0A7R9A9Y5_9CRUS|nr:unnamed protein product [Darwinula stevensoni]CAG0897899.1 unnamed protein product [Darwinula stevensoni]